MVGLEAADVPRVRGVQDVVERRQLLSECVPDCRLPLSALGSGVGSEYLFVHRLLLRQLKRALQHIL